MHWAFITPGLFADLFFGSTNLLNTWETFSIVHFVPPPHPTWLDGTEYGLSDADMEASYATVKSMAEQIDADVILLREHQEAGGKVRDYLVRKRVGDNDFLEVR